MFCGACLRDNALVKALRQAGHSVTLLPLYLPLKTDEPDESRGAPVFFGGINVYLEQRFPVFQHLPAWLRRWLDSPKLLRLVGTRAAQTRPDQVGDLTVSMLRGETGNQAREIDELIAWLRDHERPDIICLSNGLLAGMIRRLKRELGVAVVGTLQGEDAFVDALAPNHREEAWRLLSERLAEADGLVAASRYYADQMARRLGFASDRIAVVPNGLSLEGWKVAETRPQPPVLGYFARMCTDKGLDRLVDAYLLIRRSGRVPGLRLAVGGGLSPSDQPLVDALQAKLRSAGVWGDCEFRPNLTHAEKQEFLRGLSVLSVPAHYGEAFGLYLIEAMAAGVPWVQPATGAFPEIAEASGGGLLCRANDSAALAEEIVKVLEDSALAARLGQAGRASVERLYHAGEAARRLIGVFDGVLSGRRSGRGSSQIPG
jgi:glycosyltransferase involved in cell wall biosynthesis